MKTTKHKRKRVMAVLLLAAALCVTACGQEADTSTDMPVESPSAESPSDESGTQDSTEESQSAEEEEEEEEATISWIFSDMPIAAYEVTGLGVGRFDESAGIPYLKVDEEAGMFVEVSNPDDADADVTYLTNPFVKLTPGENTFVIFCMQGDEEGEYGISTTVIQSPSGSGQWEAVRYSCLDGYIEMVNFSLLTRRDADTYDEETYGGSFYSLLDYSTKWIGFSEIYHPDAPQNDAIYVIDAIAYSYEGGQDDMDDVLAGMVEAFERRGATSVEEIPVEEALERYNIVVTKAESGEEAGAENGEEAEAEAKEEAAGYTAEDIEAKTMYASISLTVRTGPSTEYSKVGTLSVNEAVTVTGVADTGWYRLDYNGAEMYASNKYLQDTQVVTVASASTASTSTTTSSVMDDSDIPWATPVSDEELAALMASGVTTYVYGDNASGGNSASGSVQESQFMESMAREAFDIVNQYRMDAGLEALPWNDALYEGAKIRAQELVTLFSHYRPNGEYYSTMKGDFFYVGENAANGQTSASQVCTDWYNSEGHRNNMLNSSHTQGAIACWYENGRYYWIAWFAW